MGNCYTLKGKKAEEYYEKPDGKIGTRKELATSTNETNDSSHSFEPNFEWPDKKISKRSSTVRTASLESFNTLKLVGKGSYGKVFMVEQKDTKLIYAMKVLKKSAILDERGKERVKTERDIIMKIRHPYIVKLHYSFQTESKLFFILDFLNGGDLYTHLMHYGKFKENRAKFYTAEMVLALDHLHKNGIVYRDLKPQNIIIDSEGHVKLTDFGLSKADFEQDQTNTICGTIKYIAPETLWGYKYNHTVDWWSLGIILFRMLTGKLPYPTNKNSEVRIYIVKWKIEIPKKKISNPAARDLLEGLLDRDPESRLGANGVEEIMNHPFFHGIDWDALKQKKVKPPYNPKVKSPTDVRHIDPKYLEEEIISYTLDDSDLKKGNMRNFTFEDFTYTKDEVLNQAGRATVYLP